MLPMPGRGGVGVELGAGRGRPPRAALRRRPRPPPRRDRKAASRYHGVSRTTGRFVRRWPNESRSAHLNPGLRRAELTRFRPALLFGASGAVLDPIESSFPAFRGPKPVVLGGCVIGPGMGLW